MGDHLYLAQRRYEALIGTGGIGGGSFFQLEGNHTLGREESRMGRYLDRRDYCKLHIVTHYVQRLLGPTFKSLPIARVGEDAVGERLRREMTDCGMDLKHLRTDPGHPTLFSFCFVYPDKSGGNLTIDNSACSLVSAEDIAGAEGDLANYAEDALVVALPEVSLEARFKLIELAGKYACTRVGSFTSGEMPEVMASGVLQELDLLAINLDEASAILGADMKGRDHHEVAKATIWKLRHINKDLLVTITGGATGCWLWDGSELVFECPWSVQAVSTAGAGDAFLSGMLVGITAGLELVSAMRFGIMVASASVTSPHTINFATSRDSLYEMAGSATRPLDQAVWNMLSAQPEPDTAQAPEAPLDIPE